MTVYNLDGTVEETTTIGEFLYHSFVRNVFSANTGINQIEFLKNNVIIIVVSAILLVYWITLLLLYEREQVSGYKIVEDDKLFEKYNPMIAACIAQNRNVMCRDVIAVVLNLIHKEKYILELYRIRL